MLEHGARQIAGLRLDSYNLTLQENGGFIGDWVRSKTFALILEGLREARRSAGHDPLGSTSSEDRAALDALLMTGDTAADLIRQAIEIFACAFADVARRFLACPEWQGTQRIVVGGGLRENRIGEEVFQRADALLKADGLTVDLSPIRNDPDEAALLGAAHLYPPSLLEGCDAILAADIGGSNMRAGVVLLNQQQAPDFSACEVLMREHWRYKKEPVGRDEAVERLARMLTGLAAKADEAGVRLAPFVGLACPGEIRPDGSIAQGAQNLPGDWTAADFNLAERIRTALPRIGQAETAAVLHNDAVVQGLSELVHMRDVARWGVFTVGTGLGNARFTNEALSDADR
ncbi:ROK family protein [Methylobacterium nigriterrae]|uniref:ROK family protein n=1 Tax=Methylobacterium nigriterrae TaxID=3127512 RepID=UPI00301399A5